MVFISHRLLFTSANIWKFQIIQKFRGSYHRFLSENFPSFRKRHTFALLLTELLNIIVKNMRIGKDREKNSTEQAIMSAAEELFLENGYNLTTTTMIARKAGVTHAMLHYYFRTKEHIFIKVLDKNLKELLDSFHTVMKKDAPFWESLKTGISTHFDFLAAHPRLPGFLYDTVRFNPELIAGYRGRIRDTLQKIIGFHYRLIQEEIDRGRINPIDPGQLIIDIATLNLSSFMLIPAAGRLFEDISPDRLAEMLASRKDEIIRLIRARLYGDIEKPDKSKDN